MIREIFGSRGMKLKRKMAGFLLLRIILIKTAYTKPTSGQAFFQGLSKAVKCTQEREMK
jgi:hypothetical protein